MKQPEYTSNIAVPAPKKLEKNKVLSAAGVPAKAGGPETNVETPSQKVRGGGAATKGLRFSDNDLD